MGWNPNFLDKSDSKIPAIPWILAGFFNGLFVIMWILLQWVVSQVANKFPLDGGINTIILKIFKILFSISTLIPIVFFIAKDTIVMYKILLEKVRSDE